MTENKGRMGTNLVLIPEEGIMMMMKVMVINERKGVQQVSTGMFIMGQRKKYVTHQKGEGS